MQLPRAVQDLSLDSIRSVDSSTLVKAGVGAGLAVGATYLGVRMLQRSLALRPKRGPFTPQTLPEGAYDAVIVGAGGRQTPLACCTNCWHVYDMWCAQPRTASAPCGPHWHACGQAGR